jgi:HD superfamily phosphodiesterase
MNLTRLIESAENKYKQILEDFFISVYTEKYLSSHGIDHHRRVWGYSKEILKSETNKTVEQIPELASKLIIACYLHDIGMSVYPGEKHGNLSRKLCLQFLANNNLRENDFYDVLEAIEYHDNKDYNNIIHQDDLLTILSVSDDLDAFGCIGIFRYLEIYLTRGINPEKIGYMIRENARKRYDNFINAFGSADELVVKHWARYYLLDMFFTRYNDQLPFYQFGQNQPSGFCGVVEIIGNIMQNHLHLKDFYSEPKKHTNDPLILWYLIELEKEFSKF